MDLRCLGARAEIHDTFIPWRAPYHVLFTIEASGGVFKKKKKKKNPKSKKNRWGRNTVIV